MTQGTAKLEWFREAGSEACYVGNLKIYKHADGTASVAVNRCWISALFTSPEAVLSWRRHWDDAEAAFAALNPPTGKGENLLGIRGAARPR